MTRLRSRSGQQIARWALAALAAVLVGCGGGGSGPDAAATPAVPAAPVTPPAAPAPAVQIGFTSSQITAGQTTTLGWSATNATTCAASGAWSGSQPTSGSLTLTVTATGSSTYALDCSGPGGTANAAATLSVVAPIAANVLAVTVDHGPAGDSFDMPFVSVTVCAPGTTACRTVDHVLVDTGSEGLRLMASALGPATDLPAVGNAASAPLAECGQFTSGFTWGSVRRADVRLGGEFAAGIPIQVISDPAVPYASIPLACSHTGANMGTAAALGANGILGVSQSTQDCGAACTTSTAPGVYYACAATGCTGTVLPLESQLANPVSSFAVDNNGLALTMPAVPAGGSQTLLGTLTFGIGTQPNNQLPDAATVYTTNARGNFSTIYKGATYTSSFIDSGSNGIFFDDPGIAVCSGFYCPPTPLALSAVNVSPSGATGTVNFTIEKLPSLATAPAAINAGGTAGLARTFDWGLPFFFGRTVFVGIEGAKAPRGNGPFWAY